MKSNLKDKTYLTKLKALELEKELNYLQEVKEPELAQKVKEAREMGNLEENDVFISTLEQKEEVSRRIRELQKLLSNAKIIEEQEISEKNEVYLGCKVVVEVEGRKDSFKIVGVDEAAPMEGKISHESPVGKSLIGTKVGQEVLVETEVYSTIYKIIEIENE